MARVNSSEEEDNLPPPRAKPRHSRDVSPPADDNPLPPRSRQPSAKQKTTNKENSAALQAQIKQLQKQLKNQAKKHAKVAPSAPRDTDPDGPESEERDDDEGDIVFPSTIKPLGTIQVPEKARVEKPLLRKTKKTDKPAKISPRAFLRLPEPTTAERLLDSEPTPPPSPSRNSIIDIDMEIDDPPTRSSRAPPASPSAAVTSEQQGRKTSASKRPLADADSSTPAPKRSKTAKPAGEEAAFREGFTPGKGKPNAKDYAPIPHALIIRACADYSARVLALNAFPDVQLQSQWAAESFRSACRSKGVHVILSDRIAKIITARGSQIRGKIIETCRSLFASHYKLERSTAKKVIAANKKRADDLLNKMSMHYKDPATRTGYAENPILMSIRRLTTFLNKESPGAVFPSYFNPLPLGLIALELTALEFCAHEWDTGSHIQAKFFEKAVGERYLVHVTDTEKWAKLNLVVSDKLRSKWYRRVSQTFTMQTQSQVDTTIDEDHEDSLRAQMEDRTGDTDSEAEGEEEDDGDDCNDNPGNGNGDAGGHDAHGNGAGSGAGVM